MEKRKCGEGLKVKNATVLFCVSLSENYLNRLYKSKAVSMLNLQDIGLYVLGLNMDRVKG